MWEYVTDEGSHDLFMDINEQIRFRVIDEDFVDLTPTGPAAAAGGEALEVNEHKKAPYSITVRISTLRGSAWFMYDFITCRER